MDFGFWVVIEVFVGFFCWVISGSCSCCSIGFLRVLIGFWVVNGELDFFFFLVVANLRFLYVEFNWFLRNMMDFEFWKFIFSVILLTMCVVWVYGFQNLIYIILLNPYNVIEVAIFWLFCCCFCCCSWHQIFGF